MSVFKHKHAAKLYLLRIRKLLEGDNSHIFFKLFFYCHDVSTEYVTNIAASQMFRNSHPSKYELCTLIDTLSKYISDIPNFLKIIYKIRPKEQEYSKRITALTKCMHHMLEELTRTKSNIVKTTEYESQVIARDREIIN